MRFQSHILPLIAILALPGFVVLMWVSPSLNHEFFCRGETSCFREWVSALSGYFAIVAAYLTIREMNRQTEAAIEAQRETVELAMSSSLMKARAGQHALRRLEFWIGRLDRLDLKSRVHDTVPWCFDPDLQRVPELIGRLQERLSNPKLRIAEELIAPELDAAHSISELQHALDRYKEIVDRYATGQSPVPLANIHGTHAGVALAVTQAKNYSRTTGLQLSEFIARWEARIR